MNDLFSSPLLWVEQPLRAPAARSHYKILDGGGTLVAKASEEKVSLGRQAARTAVGGARERTVQVTGPGGEPLVVIHARNEGGGRVLAPNGAVIGTLDASRRGNYHSRDLNDAAGRLVGTLEAAKVGRTYRVRDAAGTQVARIDKKWTGVLKEMLTTVDRYRVEIHHPLYDPLRVLVAVSAVALDMIFFEQKDWPVPG